MKFTVPKLCWSWVYLLAFFSVATILEAATGEEAKSVSRLECPEIGLIFGLSEDENKILKKSFKEAIEKLGSGRGGAEIADFSKTLKIVSLADIQSEKFFGESTDTTFRKYGLPNGFQSSDAPPKWAWVLTGENLYLESPAKVLIISMTEFLGFGSYSGANGNEDQLYEYIQKGREVAMSEVGKKIKAFYVSYASDVDAWAKQIASRGDYLQRTRVANIREQLLKHGFQQGDWMEKSIYACAGSLNDATTAKSKRESANKMTEAKQQEESKRKGQETQWAEESKQIQASLTPLSNYDGYLNVPWGKSVDFTQKALGIPFGKEPVKATAEAIQMLEGLGIRGALPIEMIPYDLRDGTSVTLIFTQGKFFCARVMPNKEVVAASGDLLAGMESKYGIPSYEILSIQPAVTMPSVVKLIWSNNQGQIEAFVSGTDLFNQQMHGDHRIANSYRGKESKYEVLSYSNLGQSIAKNTVLRNIPAEFWISFDGVRDGVFRRTDGTFVLVGFSVENLQAEPLFPTSTPVIENANGRVFGPINQLHEYIPEKHLISLEALSPGAIGKYFAIYEIPGSLTNLNLALINDGKVISASKLPMLNLALKKGMKGKMHVEKLFVKGSYKVPSILYKSSLLNRNLEPPSDGPSGSKVNKEELKQSIKQF